jgi:hypothetical protein
MTHYAGLIVDRPPRAALAPSPEMIIDGRFTNDKFCSVRLGQLAPRRSRIPFHLRCCVPPQDSAQEAIHPRRGDHAPATMEDCAALDLLLGCAAGRVSCQMETWERGGLRQEMLRQDY